jgi:hypothetical protein
MERTMEQSLRRWPLVALALLGSLTLSTLAACGDDEEDASADEGNNHAHDEGTLAEEACEHTAEGPFLDVTATAVAEGAPSGTAEHTAVRVALATEGDGNVGYVSYEADEDGDFVFFLSQDLPFAILDGAGAEVEIEATTPVDTCGEVAVQHVAELSVGRYLLRLGPTTEASSVSLVAEHAGEAHDHSDE